MLFCTKGTNLAPTDPQEFSKQHLIKSEEPFFHWKTYSVYFGKLCGFSYEVFWATPSGPSALS